MGGIWAVYKSKGGGGLEKITQKKSLQKQSKMKFSNDSLA